MIQIDMPIPERCGVCFAMHTDNIGLESWCGIDETARDIYTEEINTKRPDWCPLKEQEAVKPKSKVRHGANAQIQHFCGNCNSMLHGKPKYCSECGKPILWKGR